ncbi:MAG: ABC transporter ATP-binding protein [Candidatus Hodarchaeales archaeon]
MLLECKDLIKIFPSPIEGLMFPALRGLDLAIDKGQLISIIGPSGAGKSTLLRLISAFEKPSSGEIWFEGKLVNRFIGKSLLEYRQKVGVMYQDPRDNLVWSLNVLQNIMLPMRYSGNFPGHQKEKAVELLTHVGLAGKELRKPSQLSGGEQQRVSIAVALANDPILLLADEPTGELDSITTTVIIDYLCQLNQDLGLCVLVVTHDKRFAKMTDKTYRIQDGRLTTYHVRAKETPDIDYQEEIIIVDSQGNLRLPSEVMQQFKDLKSVKVKINGRRIELIPFQENNRSKEK